MDLPSLAVVLQAALSPNPDERKAAEQSLNQVCLRKFIFSLFVDLNFVFFGLNFDSDAYRPKLHGILVSYR